MSAVRRGRPQRHALLNRLLIGERPGHGPRHLLQLRPKYASAYDLPHSNNPRAREPENGTVRSRLARTTTEFGGTSSVTITAADKRQPSPIVSPSVIPTLPPRKHRSPIRVAPAMPICDDRKQWSPTMQ